MGKGVDMKETMPANTTLSLFEKKMKSLDAHPDVLNSSGAKLELLVQRIVHETTHDVPRGKELRSHMKPHLWIIQPTMDPSGLLSFRRVGANLSSYEYGNTTRRESAGKYIGQMCGYEPEREAGAKAALEQLRGSDSGYHICTCICVGRDPSVAVSFVAPLCVEGKMCLITCSFNLMDEVDATRCSDPQSEFPVILRVLDRFKSEVYQSQDAMAYARANLREYMLVDYPRKFMWQDSQFTVKNTFLTIQSPYSATSCRKNMRRRSTSPSGQGEKHDDGVLNPVSAQPFEGSQENFEFFERICADIGLMFASPKDADLGGVHRKEHHVERVGSKVIEWNLEHVNPYIDKWRASWREDFSYPRGPTSNDKFSATTASGRSSPSLFSNRPLGVAGLTSSSSSLSEEHNDLLHDEARDEEDEDTSFCVLRTQSAPTVGSGGDPDYLPLYLQNYGYGYITSRTPPQRLGSTQQQAPMYGALPMPAMVASERLLRNPDATKTIEAQLTRKGAQRKGNVKKIGGEASQDGDKHRGGNEQSVVMKRSKRAKSTPRSSSRAKTADAFLRMDLGAVAPADADSSSPASGISTAEEATVQKLQIGDRVQLHSFPHATWLWGLTGQVKHVLVERKRRNRVNRVTIVYDNPEYQALPKYLKTIPMSNARLIQRCGVGTEHGGAQDDI